MTQGFVGLQFVGAKLSTIKQSLDNSTTANIILYEADLFEIPLIEWLSDFCLSKAVNVSMCQMVICVCPGYAPGYQLLFIATQLSTLLLLWIWYSDCLLFIERVVNCLRKKYKLCLMFANFCIFSSLISGTFPFWRPAHTLNFEDFLCC